MAGFPQSNIDWSKYIGGLQSKADRDLKNLNIITNNILEIPQDIKLELKDGTLTLKAGSKLQFPSKTFIEKITDADATITGAFSEQCMVWYHVGLKTLVLYPTQHTYSGEAKPISVKAPTSYWYNTKENEIYITSDSGASWVSSSLTLPVGIVTTKDGAIKSIDQVFNGFGYIGSTWFVLPGVKGLIPDGKNEDGSLKNTQVAVDNVWTSACSGDLDTNLRLFSSLISQAFLKYDNTSNFNKDINGNIIKCINVGNLTTKNGRIVSFKVKQSLQMLDYNTPHITESYRKGGSGYNVYSNGYCEQWGRFTTPSTGKGTLVFFKPFVDKLSFSITVSGQTGPSEQIANWYAMVGDENWSNSGITILNSGKFVAGVLWQAKGYIK